MSKVSLEFTGGRQRRYTWGRKDEEYMADFCLIARRILDEFEHRVFRFHFLLGADWRLCCRRMGLDRGNFFHCVYRIQQKLGRTFRELKPYGLFPLDEYFYGSTAAPGPNAVSSSPVIPIRPPVRISRGPVGDLPMSA